jgi:hypothetical protein
MHRWRIAWLVMTVSTIAPAAHAQGVLTLTPTRSMSTTVGTGTIGYTAVETAASDARLASPSAIVYDATGNLYLADSNNHVVRKILKGSGVITTIAGVGTAGFSGDGGAATAAQLDTPTGLALDSSGNLFIADSHNQRIREVAGGIITTVAGTGTAGFAGDGGLATSAQLALPSAVVLDKSGRLLIADTNNQRIRAVASGLITTVVGNGEELFAGDGGQGVAASLDQPTGIAVDTAGTLYIADRRNQRIRSVSAAGVISTFAGGGASSLSGVFGGDGGAATAAGLARPVGVSVDSNGNVLIADTNNNRIRQVSNGAIATVVGSGEEGYAGDGGLLATAVLNAPKAAIIDSVGNLLLSDTGNQRLRSGILPTLSFGSQAVGNASTPQSLTIANTGTTDLTITQIALAAAFSVAPGGTCDGLPLTLAPGTSCIQNIAFVPINPGETAGSVTVSGAGLLPQTILLAGTGVQGTSTTTLTADMSSALAGQPVTFTAVVKPSGAGFVSFYDGATQLGTAQALANNTASLTLANLTAGSHGITALYSGTLAIAGSNSSAVFEQIADFDFSIKASDSTGTGTAGDAGTGSGSTNRNVVPGQPASYAFTVQPLAGPFNFPVALTATGLPPGATVTFSPQNLTVGAGPASFTMEIKTTANVAGLHGSDRFGAVSFAFGMLLLPFSAAVRRRIRHVDALRFSLALLVTGVLLTSVTGCAGGDGFFAQARKTYTIQVIGTAKGATGTTLQHVANVQLTVQ